MRGSGWEIPYTEKNRGCPPNKRPVIVSDLPPTVQSEIVRLRKEGNLINEIAVILPDLDQARFAALQSQWSVVKDPLTNKVRILP